MRLQQRLFFYTMMILGITFVILGLALDELKILETIDTSRVERIGAWRDFLTTWVHTMNPPQTP